jgi:LmbE family N-acetylglucosaminyl deacetylase
MAVHAHPDDEALFTGGMLARYAAEGVRTVVVTCTGGELGFGPGGVGFGAAGHDQAATASLRRRNLEESCRILGVTHLERLGYRDSGMAGWAENDAAGAFCAVPVSDPVSRLARLMERYRPEVVVTYGADGLYGHPDHVRAHRITVAASDSTGIPSKVYFVTVTRTALSSRIEAIRADGIEPPVWLAEVPRGDGDAVDAVDAVVDCRAVVGVRHRALEAHAGQADVAQLLGLGPEICDGLWAFECFVRGRDRTGTPVPEDDLFAGVR